MFDYLYYSFAYMWILVPGLLLGFWAQSRVSSTYKKYAKIPNKRGLTGADTAKYILEAYNIKDVKIEMVGGHLTDHYDPSNKVLRLSQNIYSGVDVAALGIAAHEVGHAIQHNKGYAPLVIRNGFYPISALGSNLGPTMVLIGLVIGGLGSVSTIVMNIGIVLFAFAVFFSLVTLPVEFDASSRAIKILDKGGFLDGEELVGAKKVLGAAALTYVAAAVMSVLSLIRLIFLSRREE